MEKRSGYAGFAMALNQNSLVTPVPISHSRPDLTAKLIDDVATSAAITLHSRLTTLTGTTNSERMPMSELLTRIIIRDG